MKGLIYEIQRYCVDDGPGIRTVVFLKGCPLRCPWCHNPESQDNRQEIGVYINRCIKCMKCYKACPRDAIVFDNGKRIERSKCNRCGLCVNDCPSRCLVRIGKYYEPAALLFEILKDISFYEISGGGVTFSGGEPIYQSEFLKEILSLCKKKGIHTAVETSGYATWEKFKEIKEYTDLFLFDLKIWHEELHKKVIGGDRSVITENFTKLIRSGTKVIPRIPLIPDYTNRKENLEGWSEFLKEFDCEDIHFLQFHNLGEFKREVIR